MIMNDFFNLIANRESIRSYNPERTIDQEILIQILESGRMAPSAANYQPWTFLLISSHDMLSEVRKCYPRTWFADAPHILIVVGNRNEAWVREDGYLAIETDLTIAMDHMILAAENLGIGTCWIAHFNYDLLRKVLSLKDEEVIFALTPLGYPKDGFVKRGLKTRKPLDQVVKFL
jgi:nitroreductase